VDPPALPSGAKPPSVEDLERMAAAIEALPKDDAAAAYLGEDWATQGDWVGRYGRLYAMLCAMNAPQNNQEIGYLHRVRGQLGPHIYRGDSLRHWIHEVVTNDRRSLYNPAIAIRRQAEWDDHGEAYEFTHEGPDLWIRVEVPHGIHSISLYFMNKDGRQWHNRLRDYVVTLKAHPGPFQAPPGVAPELVELRDSYFRRFPPELLGAPELARARVRDFWGGVYKTFVVRGAGYYYVHVARNGSYNTNVCAVFLDEVFSPKGAQVRGFFWLGGVEYAPPNLVAPEAMAPEDASIHRLWARLRPGAEPSPPCPRPYLLFLARAASPQGGPFAEYSRWQLRLWTDSDREAFDTAMAAGWRDMQQRNPQLRSRSWLPHSPGTTEP
jgi:hypothetical protein